MPRQLDFAKGHGTMNDFVVFADPEGAFDPSPAEVRFLCDRRAGVGADGVLRAVPGRFVDGRSGDPHAWFMDYRNADGSLAEMCGNGVRVFLIFLKRAGLVPDATESLAIGTRAGVRTATYLPDGTVRVWMGRPVLDAPVTVTVGDAGWAARAVDVGNPHAVAIVDAPETLAALDLTRMPAWTPVEAFPNGVNLEFVEVLAPGEVRMRVYERGVGETHSCGTGTVAVAAAVAAEQGPDAAASYVVHVPGGRVRVDLEGADAYLTGPAEIVYTGSIVLPDPEGIHD